MSRRWQWPAVLVAWRRALNWQQVNERTLRCFALLDSAWTFPILLLLIFLFSPFLSLSLRTAVLPMAKGAVRGVCCGLRTATIFAWPPPNTVFYAENALFVPDHSP